MFELLNGLTPFHAQNRKEFEGKVDASMFQFHEEVKEKITLECLLFLTQCLRHREEERKDSSELINHPYIVTPFDQ